MAATPNEIRLIRMIHQTYIEPDRGLPRWARRSNPIIRRQLGMYWKTILPEATFFFKAFLVQAIFVLLTLPIPFLLEMALPIITAAILLFPFAVFMYGHTLIAIGSAAARAVTDELQKDTLNLLRVTPFDLRAILASKVAASIWRQVEDLGLLLIAAALMSMPLLFWQYGWLLPIDVQPVLLRLAVILGLAVSILRLALEPFMIGMIGVAMGASLRNRASAIMATVITSFFYFLLLNLTRFIPMAWPFRFVIEFVLPLVAPLVVIYVMYRLADHMLTRG